MIVVGAIVVVIAAALLLRTLGGTHALRGIERLYVMLTPLPLVLCFIVPAAVGLTFGFIGAHTVWIHGVTWTGVIASTLLGLAGIVLVVRAMRRGERWGWPLGASMVLAAMPSALLALGIALMFRPGR